MSLRQGVNRQARLRYHWSRLAIRNRMREVLTGCHVERSWFDSHANCWVKSTRRLTVRRRKRSQGSILAQHRRIILPGLQETPRMGVFCLSLQIYPFILVRLRTITANDSGKLVGLFVIFQNIALMWTKNAALNYHSPTPSRNIKIWNIKCRFFCPSRDCFYF
jgi:hypothetical protein